MNVEGLDVPFTVMGLSSPSVHMSFTVLPFYPGVSTNNSWISGLALGNSQARPATESQLGRLEPIACLIRSPPARRMSLTHPFYFQTREQF